MGKERPYASAVLFALLIMVATVLTVIGALFLLSKTDRIDVEHTDKSLTVRESTKAFAERTNRPEAKWGFPSEGGVPRPGFTTKLNGRTHQPDWVIWKVDPVGAVDRSGFGWKNDPNVPEPLRQHAKAYAGAHWQADGVKHETRDSRLEIGHQKPAHDSKQSAAMMQACMVLEDNLCPQVGALNEKTWRFLEAFVDKTAETAETPRLDVYCVTGPLWYADPGTSYTVQVLDDGTPVPTHFFKAILTERSGGHIELSAWILPNIPTPPANFEEGATTSDEVERRAGIDLWSTLPDDLETKLEATK